MNLSDAIVVLEKRVPDNFCDLVIAYINYINEFEEKGVVGDSELKKSNSRIVKGYSLKKDKITDIILHRHVNNIIKSNYINYKAKFFQLKLDKLMQIDFLKYDIGGKYDIHHDHGYTCERTLSVILNLNENYEGGDFVFYEQNAKTEMKRVKCKKGTVIMFPSNFLYPHAVEPITKGTRYSIVSWLV